MARPMAERTGPFTDLYEFTMVQSYLEHGMTGEAVFDLHVRSLPPNRGYMVAAGLTEALAAVRDFTFSEGDLAYLAEQGLSDELLDHLADFSFSGKIRAMPEGRLVFPHEPLVQVQAPLPEAQILETVLLNRIHVGTVVATKAARCLSRAGGATLVDFGARRAHGREGARSAARCAYLAGFDGTSLVEAARDLGIPCYGTMAHAFVQAFDDERAALEAFASSFPDRTTLLIDTYDTVEGARRTVEVARSLAGRGVRIGGVRLDSGDLADLADKVRRILDEAGLEDVRIFASGGLDEAALQDLVDGGAPIDGFGIGTALATSRDAPSLDMSYKLAAYDGEPVMKLSQGKRTLPGAKQVFRSLDEQGMLEGDVLGLQGEDLAGRAVLREVDVDGIRDPDALSVARERFLEEFERLPGRYKAIENPSRYPVDRSADLADLVKRAEQRVDG